ncbi:hypothetical protein ABI59_11950 [Acidobacteria bacterium Mor1]|nr:hypothetical protein ABI59_11950 [Acidobacteria bacterium Mor1]
MSDKPKTRLWMRVLLAVLPSLLLLGMLEIGGRLAGFRPETWSALDDRLGYRMSEPSQRFPVEAERADVLLLGDSITYPGYPVADTKQSFADLLAGKGYEVINLSGIGYGTDQQLLLLERHLDELPPVHTVVVNFCLFNDFIDNVNEVNPHDGFRPKPYFELVDDELAYRGDHLKFSTMDRFSLWVRQRSGAVYLIRRLLGMDRKQDRSAPSGAAAAPRRFRAQLTGGAPAAPAYAAYRERVVAGLPVTRSLLQRIRDIAGERLGAQRFVVMLHPTGYKPESRPLLSLDDELADYFAKIAEDTNSPMIGSVDLGCIYELDGVTYEQAAFDRVGHLTVEGHARVADEIEGVINLEEGRPLTEESADCYPHLRSELKREAAVPDPR